MNVDELSNIVIGLEIKVHKALVPGYWNLLMKKFCFMRLIKPEYL